MTQSISTTQSPVPLTTDSEVRRTDGQAVSEGKLNRRGASAQGAGNDYGSLQGRLRPNIYKLIQGHNKYLKKLHPDDLLNPHRFDLVAKYIYARHRELKIDSSWALQLYLEHLKVFNGFSEPDGSGKTGAEAFLRKFHETLDSIYKTGFDVETSLIPIGRDSIILDGSHRVAACLLYNRQIVGLVCDVPAFVYDYQFFKNYTKHVKSGLSDIWLDAMALEYCRLKKNTYIVSVFPSAVGKEDCIQKILRENGEIFYRKVIDLKGQGPILLMRQMYRNENWLGSWNSNFRGAVQKARLCFRQPGPVRVYGFESDRLQAVNEAKTRIREIFKIDKHSVHINDTHEETLRLARIFFNANSIHFLNHAKPKRFTRFDSLLKYYSNWLQYQQTDPEYYCIDGSAVMAAYGIRDAKDLDFLHFGHDDVTTEHGLVSCHNKEICHYTISRDDIIFNPNNHFYFDGVKFAALHVIGSMKQKRAEDKDKRDIASMGGLLKRPHEELCSASAASLAKGPGSLSGTQPADNQLVGLIFSKDRAMQLDCVLRSFQLHCLDSECIDLKVLYRTTDELHRVQYRQLISDHAQVEFREEADFKNDMLSLLAGYEYVLFLVDDNIFVGDFCLNLAVRSLSQNPDALGFSLRLGKNITKRLYPRKTNWIVPQFIVQENEILKFDWSAGDVDQGYGYPLEVSSSIYRMHDLYPLLKRSRYSNPNTLEYILDQQKAGFKGSLHRLLCYDRSVTFCNPLNLVQTAWINHAGNDDGNSAHALSKKFSNGYRIDVNAYAGFIPQAYHQEVELVYERRPDKTDQNQTTSESYPIAFLELTSIVILNFNGLGDIKTCLSSISECTSEPYEIIVIDNASTDGSRKFLRSLSDILLIENKTNIGCPPARAQAMALAKGEYLVFLDNDTVVTPGWLAKFQDHFKAHPQLGLLGPRSNFVSGPQLVPNAGYKNREELYAFAQSFAVENRGRLTSTHRLVGFCLAIRREVINMIGSIDSQFGKFGFEDNDYTWRSIIAGFFAAIANDVFIHHTGGPQLYGDPEYNELLREAWEIFKKKWQLPSELAYGAGYQAAQILSRSFEPSLHYMPLPDVSCVRPLVYKSKNTMNLTGV